MAPIESLLSKDEVELVAAPLKQPLIDIKDFLEQATTSREAALAADVAEVGQDIPSLKDVSDAVAKAKKHIALLTNMLAAIAKTRGR